MPVDLPISHIPGLLARPFVRFYERLDDRRGCVPLLALTVLLTGALACASPGVTSHWRTRDIQIDGALSDWQGWQVGVQGLDARLAVANDETYLYLSLATSDPDLVKEISLRGLNVWFDPRGGQSERLGLRLPPAGPRYPGPGGRLDVGAPGGPPRPERRLPPPERRGGVDLLGPGPDEHRWINHAEAEAAGFRSAMAHDASLVYELRVPLEGKDGWSLKPTSSGGLGIGLIFARKEDSSWTGRNKDAIESPRPDEGGGPLATARGGSGSGPLGDPVDPSGHGLPRDSAGVIGGTVRPNDRSGGRGGLSGGDDWAPYLGSPEVWAVFQLATPPGK